jgi:AraC-like DNA-binding protein
MPKEPNSPAIDEVLLHPERWQVILPATAEEHPAGLEPDPRRRRWSLAHAHRGPQRELLLSLKGNGYFGLAGKLHPCRPGMLFVIDPGIDHDNFYPQSSDGLEHLWIRSLGPHVFTAWFRIVKGRLRQLHKHLNVFPERELGVIAGSLSGPDDLPPVWRAARLRLLVGLVALHLVRRKNEDTPAEALPSARLQAQVVEAICAHIEATAGKGVTLDFLSDFSGYSKFHLLRMFAKQAGCTVHQYIDRTRVSCVQRLRAEGRNNSAMAETLGFSSPTSFIRWRRRQKL